MPDPVGDFLGKFVAGDARIVQIAQTKCMFRLLKIY